MSVEAPGLERPRTAYGPKPSQRPLFGRLVDARRWLRVQGFVGPRLVVDVPEFVEGALLSSAVLLCGLCFEGAVHALISTLCLPDAASASLQSDPKRIHQTANLE